MENVNLNKCSSCHGDLELINTTGTTETYRCNQCGKEETVHFSITPNELYSLQEGTVEIFITSSEKDSITKTIMDLRKVVPELKNQSVENLKNQLHVKKLLSLGRYFPDQADDLIQRLEELGLNVRCAK